jgi:hypothetical protein
MADNKKRSSPWGAGDKYSPAKGNPYGNGSGKPVTKPGMSALDSAEFINNFVPITGDIQSLYYAQDDLKKGNYGSAALNGLGILPFVPSLGGVIRNKGGAWLGDSITPTLHNMNPIAQRQAEKGYRIGDNGFMGQMLNDATGNDNFWRDGLNQFGSQDAFLSDLVKTNPELAAKANLFPSTLSKHEQSLDNWINSVIGNYIKRDLGAESDQVRIYAQERAAALRKERDAALAKAGKIDKKIADAQEKGEPANVINNLMRAKTRTIDEANANFDLRMQNILHFNPSKEIDTDIYLPYKNAVDAGFNPFQAANPKTDPVASAWEMLADTSIVQGRAKKWRDENRAGSDFLKNVPDDETVMRLPMSTQLDAGAKFGFSDLIDHLKTQLEAGKINPDTLTSMSLTDAIKSTSNANIQRELDRVAAQKAAMEGLPVHHEYDDGYKWVELIKNHKELPEGVTVSHYPQGHGWVMEDAAGNQVPLNGQHNIFGRRDAEEQALKELNKRSIQDVLTKEGEDMGHCIGGYCNKVLSGESRNYSLRDSGGNPHVTIETNPDLGFDEPWAITQIQGKSDKAPDTKYMQYVQDFVKRGGWGALSDSAKARAELYKVGDPSIGVQLRFQPEVVKHINRIYPTHTGPGGGVSLSGPFGVRKNMHDLINETVANLPEGQYYSNKDIIDHLSAVEPMPIERGYINTDAMADEGYRILNEVNAERGNAPVDFLMPEGGQPIEGFQPRPRQPVPGQGPAPRAEGLPGDEIPFAKGGAVKAKPWGKGDDYKPAKGSPYGKGSGAPAASNGPSAMDTLEFLNNFAPITGDLQSLYYAQDDLRKGDYGNAALNGLGILPFVPSLGAITRDVGGLQRMSEALNPHAGGKLMVTQADRTKVGGQYDGGPGFSSLQLELGSPHEVANAAWGVAAPQVGTTMINANKRAQEATDGDVLWTNLIGSPDQHRSNPQVFNALVKKFSEAKRSGNVSDELAQSMNDRLRSFYMDDERIPLFGQGIDVVAKNLGSHGDTFGKRAAIAEVIGGKGVGGKKGQVFDYDELIRKTTDPVLLGANTHDIGYRLFSLDNGMIHRPDLHSGYPYILTGTDHMKTFSPAPRDLVLKDFIDEYVARKGRDPGVMGLTRGYPPSVDINDQLLQRLYDNGYKSGGKVKKNG